MPGNIANITPETIAQWPTPNYVDPIERSWMPIYCGVIYGVSSLMIALRLWLRVLNQAGGLGIDDALLVVAWLGSSAFTTVVILACSLYHTDRHAWDIPLEYFEKIAQMVWMAQFTSLVTQAATKVSVLCFYRRLVAGTYSRKWKWAVICAIFFTLAWTVTFMIMLIVNCSPTEAYWKSFDLTWGHEYTCHDTTAVNLLAGIFAAVSDLYAVALPCVMTRNMNLSRRQRIALDVIFSMGLLVVAASGVRTYFTYQAGFNSDVSWVIFNGYLCAQFELQLSIICASLPALRVFLRKYLAIPFSLAGSNAGRKSPSIGKIDISRISGPFDPRMHDELPTVEDEEDDVVHEDKPIMYDDVRVSSEQDYQSSLRDRKTGRPSTIKEEAWSIYGARSPHLSVPMDARLAEAWRQSPSYNVSVIEGYERSMHGEGRRSTGGNWQREGAYRTSLIEGYERSVHSPLLERTVHSPLMERTRSPTGWSGRTSPYSMSTPYSPQSVSPWSQPSTAQLLPATQYVQPKSVFED